MRPPISASLLLLASAALACSAPSEPRRSLAVPHRPLARPPLPRAEGARFPAARAGAVIVVTSDQLLVEAPEAPSRPPRQRAILPLLAGALVTEQGGVQAQLAPLTAALRALRARDASAEHVGLAVSPTTSWRLVEALFRAAIESGYAEVGLLVEQPGHDGAIAFRPATDAPPQLAVTVGRAGYAIRVLGDSLRRDCVTFGSRAAAVPRRDDGRYDPASLHTCATRMCAAPWWRDVGGGVAGVALALQPVLTAQDVADVAAALHGVAPGFATIFPGVLRDDGPPSPREGPDPEEHTTPRPPDSTSGGEGSIDTTAVLARVREQIPTIRRCYEHELRRDAGLTGRVVVWFRIAMDGSVADVDVRQPDGFGEVGPCIARVFRALAMPRPSGGQVEFSFPFTFSR